MIYSKIIDSPIGSILVCALHNGICSLIFTDSKSFNKQLVKLSKDCGLELSKQTNAVIDLAEKQLADYFKGDLNVFSVPLFFVGTDFQKRVWNQLLRIEYGKTVTYKEQAFSLGDINAIRAVASANGANPIPIIIPCHRVIATNGSLTGYSGGLWRKRFLLDLESQHYKINL